jgi:uncharacterized alkaline shock family protein YloU
MSDYPQVVGKTTIAPDVLLTIARLTTLNVPGVSRMSNVPRAVDRLLKKGVQQDDGVCLEVTDDSVYVDLYTILKSDVNVRDVSCHIQHEVARAISEMVGMSVGRVNVHIEDIDYPEDPQGSKD